MSLLKKHSRPAPPDARWASRRARRVLHALLPLAAMAVLSGDAGTIGGSATGGPAPVARAAGTMFLSPGRIQDSVVGANLVFALGEHKVRPYPAAGQGLAPAARPGMTGHWAPHGLVRRRGQMGTTRRRSVNVLWGE